MRTVPPPQPRSPDDEEFVEPAPRPWWKRPRVIGLIIGGIALGAFLASRGVSHKSTDHAGSSQSTIAVIAGYEPPAAPAPPPPQSLVAADQPPPPPVVNIPLSTGFPIAPASNGSSMQSPPWVSYGTIQPPPPPPAPAPETEAKHTGLHFATATLPGSKASPAVDDTYLLMPGLLPCILDVRIDSSLPGPLMCHTPGPVYSPKGVLLMPAGTQVMGRYESLTNNGVARLHAISAYAWTKDGIWVPLGDQPFADDLGETGLPGSVNHHYWEKFSGAVLLDIGSAGLQIAQAEVSKGGSFYVTANNSGGLASQILESTINMPPTFTKQAGAPMALWLTQPISFRDSYKVTAQ